jgi:hypothetical protein
MDLFTSQEKNKLYLVYGATPHLDLTVYASKRPLPQWPLWQLGTQSRYAAGKIARLDERRNTEE